MARTTKIFSISLPPKLAQKVDRFCQKEELTKSELFRDAVKDYIGSWIETRRVMRVFPDLDKDIAQVEKDIKTGRYKQYKTLDQIIKEHVVSSRVKDKGRKGSSKARAQA